MQPSRRDLIALIRDRPANVGLTPGRYDVAVAYLLGYDDGNGGGLVGGFQEWLVQHHGGAPSRSWPALVAHMALGEESVLPNWGAAAPEEHGRALAMLWDLLDGYDSYRSELRPG